MDKKIIVTAVVVSLIILIVGGIFAFSFDKKNQEKEKNFKLPPKNALVYYYGETCPHCKEVEKWLKENKIEEKIKIEKKEVWNNQDNAFEMTKVAESCRLDTNAIGVPFLFTDGKCYIGTPEVIKVLKQKANKN